MKKLLLGALLMVSVVATVKAQDILNLRMDRNQLGLRGNVATIDEDLLVRKDYFREDWPTRKGFRKDLRQILQEDAGHIYTFHGNGRLASVVYTYRGQAGRKTTCSYASNGLLTSFTGEGYRVEAKYSGNNATVNVYAETPSYSPKVDLDHADLSKTPFTKVYPYDMTCRQELSTDGYVLKSSYYYVDSMPARVCTYTYSHLNQVLKERMVNYAMDASGSDVTVTNNTYDGNGFLVMKKVRGLAVDETYTYFNNELGDCTEMTIVRPYGTVVYTYEYEYDEEGNWTMRLCFKDGVFDNAVLRQITYGKSSAKNASVQVESADDASRKMYSRSEQEKVEKSKKHFTIDLSGVTSIFKKKSAKAEKPAKTKVVREEKSAKPERVEKSEKPAKVEKTEKPAKTEKSVKTDVKAEKNKSVKSSKTKAVKEKKDAKVKSEKEKKAKDAKVKEKKSKKQGNVKSEKEKKAKDVKAKEKKSKKNSNVKSEKEKKAKDVKVKEKKAKKNANVKSEKGKKDKDVKVKEKKSKKHANVKSKDEKSVKAKHVQKRRIRKDNREVQPKVEKERSEGVTKTQNVSKEDKTLEESVDKQVKGKVEKTVKKKAEKKVKSRK